MKKVFVFMMMFCLAATLSFAQVPPPSVNSTTNSTSADTAKKAKAKKGKKGKKHHKKSGDEQTSNKMMETNSTK